MREYFVQVVYVCTHSDVYCCYVVTTSNMCEIACLELTPWLVYIIHAVCVVILIYAYDERN